MSAIVFRRSRFLRVGVVALFLIPILYLLLTWLSDGDVPNSLKFTGKRRILEVPVLVEGKCGR